MSLNAMSVPRDGPNHTGIISFPDCRICMQKAGLELCQLYGTGTAQAHLKMLRVCAWDSWFESVRATNFSKNSYVLPVFSDFIREVACAFLSGWLSFFPYFGMICLLQGSSTYWLLQESNIMAKDRSPHHCHGVQRLTSLHLNPLVAVSSKRMCKLIETQNICLPPFWHRSFKGSCGLEHLAPERNRKMDLRNMFWIKVSIFQPRSSTCGTCFAQRYFYLWLPPRHTVKSISWCVDGVKCFSPCELPNCCAQQNTGCFLFKHLFCQMHCIIASQAVVISCRHKMEV